MNSAQLALIAEAEQLIVNRLALDVSAATKLHDELLESESAAWASGLADDAKQLRATADNLWAVIQGEI